MDSLLDCEIYRRFGVEVEVNTPSGEIKKLGKNEAPEGAEYIAGLINKITREKVEIHGWHSTHNNLGWVVKPDSSCGVEICTPILKGYYGLLSLMRVIDGMKDSVRADDRCSLHVHIDVEDLDRDDIGRILAWWIKCEAVFMDAMPSNRKLNRYCQCVGVSDLFHIDGCYTADEIITTLGDVKYFSVNTFHLCRGKRNTIEFRIMGKDACLKPFVAKNWVRLLLHFVETAIKANFPVQYESGNPWSSLCWLDPKDVFSFLGFNDTRQLSPGLQQVRAWFITQTVQNIDSYLAGIWSPAGRLIARQEIRNLWGQHARPIEKPEEELYSDKYAI